MTNPADIESQRKLEDEIEAATIALEVAVLAVIARRLGKLKDNANPVTVYAAMAADRAEIAALMDKGTRDIQAIVSNAMYNMAEDNDEWARKFYEAAQRKQKSAIEHMRMSELLRKNTDAAVKDVAAKCNSTVIEILDTQNGELLNVQDAYKRIVTKTATSIATGARAADDAIPEAVTSLSKSGLKVAYPNTYKKQIIKDGKVVNTVTAIRQKKLTRSLYTSVTTNTMDAYRTTMSELREIQGLEFGADGVEVSAHALSAPDHLPYQGRQYYFSEFQQVQDELPRQLVTGANCGHIVSPVIMGISTEKYTEAELEALAKRSTQKITFNGLSGKPLTMERYQATQYQRNIETSIRNANETAYLLRESGTPDRALESAIKQRTREYKRISRDAGLVTRMERTKAYVLK